MENNIKILPSLIIPRKIIIIPKQKPVQLDTNQVEHFNNVLHILINNKCYFDSSETGLGKSYIAMKLAQHFKLPMLIVCVTSMIGTWREMCNQYNIDVYGIYSYREFSYSSKGKNPKHGYLETRLDRKFNATDKLNMIINKGILFIVDECQNTKNESIQSYAVQEVCRIIANSKSRSLIGLLSATPTDKQNINPFLMLLGEVETKDLYKFNHVDNSYIITGLRDIINMAYRIDNNKTRTIEELYHELTRYTIPLFCSRLYNEIIGPSITSHMSKKNKYDSNNNLIELKIENLMCHLKPEDANTIISALHIIRSRMDEVNQQRFTNSSKSFRLIEICKIPIFARLIQQMLNESSTQKIIVFVNYTVTLSILRTLFEWYNPLVLEGSVTRNKRDGIIENFQQPNIQYRLLLCNTQTGGIGITLDDQNGNYPRRVLISPSYNCINLHQALGRVDRVKTKSIPHAYVIFGGDTEEQKLIDNIAMKSKIIREMVQNNKMKLIGAMPYVNELTNKEIALKSRDMYMYKIKKLIDRYGFEIPNDVILNTLFSIPSVV